VDLKTPRALSVPLCLGRFSLSWSASGLAGYARKPRVALCAVSAPIDGPRWQTSSPEDAEAFRQDLGLAEPGLERVIRSTYDLLGLISFLTAGEDECRAWTIRRGRAPSSPRAPFTRTSSAAFIRAQVVAFDDLVAAGGIAACRERGTLPARGKDYEVKDGDVIEFRHAT